MNIQKKLIELGLTLPEAPKPVAAYVPAVRAGSLIFVSGQLPFMEGQVRYRGRVGDEVTLESARTAARVAALNCLAVLAGMIDLEKVVRIVKLTGYVASAPDFFEQPQVVNGASELFNDIFGEAGRHARVAVGVTSLPLNATVEIELMVEV